MCVDKAHNHLINDFARANLAASPELIADVESAFTPSAAVARATLDAQPEPGSSAAAGGIRHVWAAWAAIVGAAALTAWHTWPANLADLPAAHVHALAVSPRPFSLWDTLTGLFPHGLLLAAALVVVAARVLRRDNYCACAHAPR